MNLGEKCWKWAKILYAVIQITCVFFFHHFMSQIRGTCVYGTLQKENKTKPDEDVEYSKNERHDSNSFEVNVVKP